MKVSKMGIVLLIFTLLVLALTVANLVMCISQGQDIPMAIGFLTGTLVLFAFTVRAIIKESKRAKSTIDDDDDDDYDDDDDE